MYAIYETATGRLVGVGSTLPDPMPGGEGVLEIRPVQLHFPHLGARLAQARERRLKLAVVVQAQHEKRAVAREELARKRLRQCFGVQA